jgi:3-oxoacyl-[acyl-carrier-protein] synthase-3
LWGGSEQVTKTAGIWADAQLRVAGLGHYYPRALVRNDPPDGPIGNDVDRLLLGSIGVRTRGVADESETEPVMAVHAATRALADADLAPEQVDLLVLGNWTQRQSIPELAPQVAHRLGATSALAFDVCGACAGFVHGVQTACALLAAHPSWATAVVVCAERFSRRVRPGSAGELVVGDAAGAAVLAKGGPGLVDSLLASDGGNAETVTAYPPNLWIRSRPELLELAVSSMVDACEELLARNGLTMADIDWVVPHPGTDLVHRRVKERLAIPTERFLTNFETRGNTGAAAIPIVLSEGHEHGRFRPGDLFLTPAVGSGWFRGALLFHL